MRVLLALLVGTSLIAVSTHAATVPASPEQKAILDALEQEPLALPASPEGASDPTAWDGMSGRWTAGLSNTKTAREKGNPLAIFLVAEGICPDIDEGFCYVSILLEFCMRLDEERSSSESTVRYAVLSDKGKHVAGYAHVRATASEKVGAFWVRRSGKWLQHKKDSAEEVVTARLMGVFADLADNVDMRLKEPPSIKPPAGTTVQTPDAPLP